MKERLFLKEFVNTFKTAKWLIVRYLVLALYLTVSSIIANKMELGNLTYFNAVLSISGFMSILGFAIVSGIGVYLNQNIYDKKKVNYYVKLGLYINVLVIFISITFLAIFYKSILHILLELPTDIDYRFYFLMLIYIFISSNLDYLTQIIKQFKIFLPEMIIAFLQSVLIIVGFVIVWLGFDLSLSLIPMIYIIGVTTPLIYSVVYLNKSNEININVMKIEKVRFNKKEIGLIANMFISEIVWQIGYTLLSMTLLKIDDKIFNQYAYFENVLDIFNGLFFAFVSVTSINICRKLGEEKFDEAYDIGKFSIYSTILIWTIYLILSLLFSYPLIMLMSKDIKQGAFIFMLLYIFLYFFRFMSWNLMSYVVCLGGKMKLLVSQEVVFALYFVILYLISSLIPNDIYLIYLIMFIPPLLQTILGCIIFKRKKWMKKID